MPWPAKSRTTENPAASTSRCTAAPIYRSAIVFNCVPVTPGRTARTTSRKASAASTPASRICWISAGVFTIIIALRVAIAFRAGSRMLLPRASACLEDLHQPAMHALDVTVANGLKQSTAPVELHQRFGLPVIHLKTPPHRLLLVIIPLVQLAAVDVAPARAPGRARFHVIDVGGLPANPAPGQPADDDVVGDIKV